MELTYHRYNEKGVKITKHFEVGFEAPKILFDDLLIEWKRGIGADVKPTPKVVPKQLTARQLRRMKYAKRSKNKRLDNRSTTK